jgi:flagellar motility protein MotE (MotC chaperone)
MPVADEEVVMRSSRHGRLRGNPARTFVAVFALLAAAPAAAQPQALEAALAEQKAGVQEAARSQARVAQLADETAELLGEYRVVIQRLDRVRIYNDNLQALLRDQEREKEDIDRQLASFHDVQQDIVPLMFELIEDLARFVELDMPFQLQARRGRVERLRELMSRSDVSVSEKYRQIMNAYQVEADYGRTTEAWEGQLGDRKVDFLRVGRVLLAYQTPDRAETGYWNRHAREWEMANAYRNDVVEGLRIARRQAAPALLRLPVPAPEEARP